jgi:hypothetical protein
MASILIVGDVLRCLQTISVGEKLLTAKGAKKGREGREERLEDWVLLRGLRDYFANFAVKSFSASIVSGW